MATKRRKPGEIVTLEETVLPVAWRQPRQRVRLSCFSGQEWRGWMREVCRKAGISSVTFFNWKKMYAGLMPSEMKRLSRPGKPTDNAFIEAFNGRFRAECLNSHWFMSLEDAAEKMEAWRRDYNEERPHSAIGNKAPAELMKSAHDTSPCT